MTLLAFSTALFGPAQIANGVGHSRTYARYVGMFAGHFSADHRLRWPYWEAASIIVDATGSVTSSFVQNSPESGASAPEERPTRTRRRSRDTRQRVKQIQASSRWESMCLPNAPHKQATTLPQAEQHFSHNSSVQEGCLDGVREGHRVSYDVGKEPKAPRAENVRDMGPPASDYRGLIWCELPGRIQQQLMSTERTLSMSATKPMPLIPVRAHRRGPVCDAISHSLAAIQPQCSVRQAVENRKDRSKREKCETLSATEEKLATVKARPPTREGERT